ncbi:MAG: PorP/SprF family type IX secretion system membrane protein, partial [Bacteroidia bacterium]
YTASPAHHGVGAMVILDKAGPLSRLDAHLTYAYHLQLGGTLNLSVGVAAGITRFGLDISKLTLEDPADPALGNPVLVGQVKPDLAMGLWLYGARFFAGLSMQQILPQKLAFTRDAAYNDGKTVPHGFATMGYKFSIDETISAIPSVMVKYVRPTAMSVDANLKVSFRDRFWLGGSYRKDDSFSALAGFNFSKMVNLTYSYDFTTSELNSVSAGSHEIVLGIQLNNVYQAVSNMRMW